MDAFVRQHLGNPEDCKSFWNQHIKRINTKLAKKMKRKYFEQYKFQLFDEYTHQNIKCLDINRFMLPLFEQFVMFFFVEFDRDRFERLETDRIDHGDFKILNNDDRRYYKLFLESWRTVPGKRGAVDWYTYPHDILLLELVLRHGVDCEKILEDLEGENQYRYKIRLLCNEQKVKNDRYYEFKRWCSVGYIIWHRLKYVPNGMYVDYVDF